MLAACRRAAETAGVDYARLVYPYLEKEMKLAKAMRLPKLCRLARVSRAGFYRWRKRPANPADPDLEVRDTMQRIALEFPCYGSRRIRFALWRRGYTVNRKRVQRLMREDNLLCLRRRKFVVTTDSNHHLPVYPNLAATLVVTHMDQLWIARYYLHSSGSGVCLSGSDSGCILATRGRLGFGSDAGSVVNTGSFAHGAAPASSRARLGASLRPGRAVRGWRLRGFARGKRHRGQHEPARQSLRQRLRFTLHLFRTLR
jgi:HTH-like domain